MTEGKAIITFGYDTTFMLGGFGTYYDDQVVTLNFRSREPGPVRDSEIKESTEDCEIDFSKFDVTMIFKTVKSIDSLIVQLNTAREILGEMLEKEKKDD